MKTIYFALPVLALLFSNACATQPCSKQEFRGKSVFGIKFDGKNELVVDEKIGPMTYQIETPESSFLIAIPNALESPEPQFELVNGTETVKLKASCGSWNQYNPYGHTWHARMNLPIQSIRAYLACTNESSES